MLFAYGVPPGALAFIMKRHLLPRKVTVFAVPGLILVAAVLLGFMLDALYRPPTMWEFYDDEGAEPIMLTVRKGDSFSLVVRELRKRHLVKRPWAINVYAFIKRYDRRIQTGTYRFQLGERPKDILERLVSGDVLKVVITIPEGFTLRQIAGVLREQAGMDPGDFSEAASDSILLANAGIEGSSLEGYLFPDTYHVPWGSDARAVIEMMLRQCDAVFDERLKQRAEEIGMTRHEVLTLASIVEAETRLPEERSLVSAVYHNRLRRRMRLEADPTVAYAKGEYKGRLLYEDLLINSPYNTYLHYGLPPGPICSPGRASVLAALYPDSSSGVLYFVARGDGSHIFSLTLREHQAAIREVKGTQKTPASSH